jgi:hypothetical protein
MMPDFLSMMVRACARLICWRNQAGAKSVCVTALWLSRLGKSRWFLPDLILQRQPDFPQE